MVLSEIMVIMKDTKIPILGTERANEKKLVLNDLRPKLHLKNGVFWGERIVSTNLLHFYSMPGKEH